MLNHATQANKVDWNKKGDFGSGLCVWQSIEDKRNTCHVVRCVVSEQKSKSKQWRVMASIKSRLCVCVSVEQSVVDARRDTHSTAFEHAMAPISHNNNKDTRSNIVNKVLLLL